MTEISGGPIEHAAEEAECVRMVLDDMGVPKRDGGEDYSLVGRVKVAIATGRPAERHMATVGHSLCDLIEELAGVEDITPAGAEMVIRRWAAGASVSLDPLFALREAVREAGSQKSWAERAGVSPQYVADVLKGRREPGDGILGPLGMERVVTYRRKA